jgi:hypothetical protein
LGSVGKSSIKPDMSNGTGNTSGFDRSIPQVKRFNRLFSNKKGTYPDIFFVAGHKMDRKYVAKPEIQAFKKHIYSLKLFPV